MNANRGPRCALIQENLPQRLREGLPHPLRSEVSPIPKRLHATRCDPLEHRQRTALPPARESPTAYQFSWLPVSAPRRADRRRISESSLVAALNPWVRFLYISWFSALLLFVVLVTSQATVLLGRCHCHIRPSSLPLKAENRRFGL